MSTEIPSVLRYYEVAKLSLAAAVKDGNESQIRKFKMELQTYKGLIIAMMKDNEAVI